MKTEIEVLRDVIDRLEKRMKILEDAFRDESGEAYRKFVKDAPNAVQEQKSDESLIR